MIKCKMYDVKVLSFYGVYKKLHKNEFFYLKTETEMHVKILTVFSVNLDLKIADPRRSIVFKSLH